MRLRTVLVSVLVLASLVQSMRFVPARALGWATGKPETMPPSPLVIAYENLVAWPELSRFSLLSECIQKTEAKNLAVSNALIDVDRKGTLVFVSHVYWSVAVCLMRSDLSIADVRSFPAKCGYTIRGYASPTVILNKHPGTGMFYKVPLRISVRDGKLVVDEIGEPERSEVLTSLTRESKG